MKEISELNFPDDLRYTEDHEWAKQEGKEIRIGISDYAQDQIGDIVFVEMPEVGDNFEKGEEFGSLESVKAVSSMFIPLGGEIVAINEALEEAPERVNDAPYESWIIEIKPSDQSELEDLLTVDAYRELLQG